MFTIVSNSMKYCIKYSTAIIKRKDLESTYFNTTRIILLKLQLKIFGILNIIYTTLFTKNATSMSQLKATQPIIGAVLRPNQIGASYKLLHLGDFCVRTLNSWAWPLNMIFWPSKINQSHFSIIFVLVLPIHSLKWQ